MAGKVGISKDSKCDVLIIGAGPAGMMMALWMARFGIDARIVDRRTSEEGFHVQADAVTARTMEICDSFDIAHVILNGNLPIKEITTWNHDGKGGITRASRSKFGALRGEGELSDNSRFGTEILTSKRLCEIFSNDMEKRSNIRVEWNTTFESLEVIDAENEDQAVYPVTVGLQQDDNFETVHAKYLIGCDGGRSRIRREVGFEMVGVSHDSVFGVLDLIPITDFPDIRRTCMIRSNGGLILQIAREEKLVRLYVELPNAKFDAAGRFVKEDISPETIFARAQEILHPYKISYEPSNLTWWTIYQVGQRVSTGNTFKNRVFLAGDAVHTHSPHAGQGMNASIQDTYNLGWKLGLVLRDHAQATALLGTYETERLKIARELIDFDTVYTRLFSGRPIPEVLEEMGLGQDYFLEFINRSRTVMANTCVEYDGNIITNTKESKQRLAKHVSIGKRFPSCEVINQSSGIPIELGRRLWNDGRFRVLLFAGDVMDVEQKGRIEVLANQLTGLINSYTPKGRHFDSLIEVITIHNADRLADGVDIHDFPEALRPFDEAVGWSYDKIYGQESAENGMDIYQKYGTDAQRGCVIIVRPDQHVGWIGEYEDIREMEKYFGGILRKHG